MLDQLSPHLISVFVASIMSISTATNISLSKKVNYQLHLHVQRVIQKKASMNNALSMQAMSSNKLFDISSINPSGERVEQFALNYYNNGVVFYIPSYYTSMKAMMTDFLTFLFTLMC